MGALPCFRPVNNVTRLEFYIHATFLPIASVVIVFGLFCIKDLVPVKLIRTAAPMKTICSFFPISNVYEAKGKWTWKATTELIIFVWAIFAKITHIDSSSTVFETWKGSWLLLKVQTAKVKYYPTQNRFIPRCLASSWKYVFFALCRLLFSGRFPLMRCISRRST